MRKLSKLSQEVLDERTCTAFAKQCSALGDIAAAHAFFDQTARVERLIQTSVNITDIRGSLLAPLPASETLTDLECVAFIESFSQTNALKHSIHIIEQPLYDQDKEVG